MSYPYLYALPTSKIYHRVIYVEIAPDEEVPTFSCMWMQIHDLMSTRLAEGVGKTPDIYGHRRCKRCFPARP